MSDQNRVVSQLRHLAKVHASNQPMTFINMTPIAAMTENLAAELIERQAETIERLTAELAAAQAKIDWLMLEYCPNEMSDAQLEGWGRHQSRDIPRTDGEK